MKLNLYKCSTKDREWYSLAKEICKGAIPLSCGGMFEYPYSILPEKIELVKEVEIELSQFLDAEAASIKRQLEAKTKELAESQESMKHIGWRRWFK
ncbi:hypothetical protein M0R72_20445 [Candidatus Pacearchaeota archaeon]|jgi:hypothetical protein|nr:hypothetical protein [Candidatus Pacearchaeota archaeon]